MNDRDRRQFVSSIEQLHNWISRSKLDPANFVRANRKQLDGVMATAIPETSRLKRAMRGAHKLRRWDELTDKQKARLVDHWKRKHDIGMRQLFTVYRLVPLEDHHIQANDLREAALSRPYRNVYDMVSARRKIMGKRHMPKPDKIGTPADRILTIRKENFKNDFSNRELGHREVTFLPNLHPDDVEIATTERDGDTIRPITVDRSFHKLHQTFNDAILAGIVALTDTDTGVQVYKLARVKVKGTKPGGDKKPIIEVYFQGIAPSIGAQPTCLTNRHNSLKSAYAAALRLYGSIIANHIEPN